MHVLLVVCAAWLCNTAGAQSPAQGETVLIKRAAQLREGPSESSRGMMALPLHTSVVRLGEKQGAWIKVSAADNTLGWVHMFDVTSPASTSAPSGNAGTSALRGITNFFNRGTAQAPGNNVATSTLGIRGLGAENLNNAQPNVAAVAQAEALRVDAAQARQFAATASLTTRTVEPLPVPAAPVSNSTSSN
jgi:hypothetical protein